jgi:pimeloyl-ACP methyl ester carboxylesterase
LNTLHERVFELSTTRLAALTNQQEFASPILCLHGWLDNAASFIPLFQQFTNEPLLALDWAGHGKSAHRSRDAHYHFVDNIYDLFLLFEQNHWQNIDIVAHSMGGMLASAFTAAFPEKVKSLTLIDTIGFITEPPAQTTKILREGILSRFQTQTKNKSFHKNIESAITARMNVSDLNYESAKLLVERGIEQYPQGYLWRSDSRLRVKSLYRFSTEQAKQLLRDIDVPVQLVYGDKGMDMVKQGISAFKNEFKQITLHELAGGHHVHMEQAQEIAKIIKNFIKSI